MSVGLAGAGLRVVVLLSGEAARFAGDESEAPPGCLEARLYLDTLPRLGGRVCSGDDRLSLAREARAVIRWMD